MNLSDALTIKLVNRNGLKIDLNLHDGSKCTTPPCQEILFVKPHLRLVEQDAIQTMSQAHLTQKMIAVSGVLVDLIIVNTVNLTALVNLVVFVDLAISVRGWEHMQYVCV